MWRAGSAIRFAGSAAAFSTELDESAGVAWVVSAASLAEADEVYDIFLADKDDERATDLTLLFPVSHAYADLPDWAVDAKAVAIPGHENGKLVTRKCRMVTEGADPPTLLTRSSEVLVVKKPPPSLQQLRASSYLVRVTFDKVFGEHLWGDVQHRPSHHASREALD